MACYDSEYEFRRRQRSQCFYAQHTRWTFYHRCRCFLPDLDVVRLWLGIDKFEEPQDSGSLREDIVEIFDALLTPIPSYEEEKETDPLSFGALFDELSSTSSSEPEYLSDSDGKSVRITGRGSDVFYLENGDVVYTTDGRDFYTTDDDVYHHYE